MDILVHVDQAPDSCRFSLSGEMTIYTAAELKAHLVAPVLACTDAEIDLSGVTEIDTAGLQVLVLLKREISVKGGRLRLAGHSPAVVEAMDLCGMGALFGDPVVISAAA